jgi:hypothetical protein
MGKSLLIGNGINRLNNHEVSWENVLRSLWVENPDRRQLEYMKHKPFGLLYEEILLSRVSPTRPLDEPPIKKRIATMVKQLKFNDYHRRIMASDIRHILTTNYDYALENSTGLNFAKKNIQPETKYSLFRRRAAEDKFIWHIHGECDLPQTITLGYDQYSGYLQKLRMYATAERNYEKGSPFKSGVIDFDLPDGKPYSWIDVFFRDDMHIIGLSLDFTEIDLWWALTYKARLKARGRETGKTYFYDWHHGEDDEPSLGKRSLLEGLGVQVISTMCSDGYEDQYKKFINSELGS